MKIDTLGIQAFIALAEHQTGNVVEQADDDGVFPGAIFHSMILSHKISQ
jgi:hypothetical protein